jgi:hypothetical protein
VTWLHQYGLAWEEGDADAAAALFTEDAVYRSSPFREPHIGRAAIREYWARATADQTGTKVRFGTPIVEGDRVAVEWWATFDDGTLPGTLYLRCPRTGSAGSSARRGTGRPSRASRLTAGEPSPA